MVGHVCFEPHEIDAPVAKEKLELLVCSRRKIIDTSLRELLWRL